MGIAAAHLDGQAAPAGAGWAAQEAHVVLCGGGVALRARVNDLPGAYRWVGGQVVGQVGWKVDRWVGRCMTPKKGVTAATTGSQPRCGVHIDCTITLKQTYTDCKQAG